MRTNPPPLPQLPLPRPLRLPLPKAAPATKGLYTLKSAFDRATCIVLSNTLLLGGRSAATCKPCGNACYNPSRQWKVDSKGKSCDGTPPAGSCHGADFLQTSATVRLPDAAVCTVYIHCHRAHHPHQLGFSHRAVKLASPGGRSGCRTLLWISTAPDQSWL